MREILVVLMTLLAFEPYISSINATRHYSLNPRANNILQRFARYGTAIENCGKRKRNVENRKCLKQCTSDADCRGSKRRCLCDGECGLSCVRITTMCSRIGEFNNGVVKYYPDNYFGSQLIYECNPGYSLVGNKVRMCEGDGWWSGESPACVRETFCEYIPIISNAIPNVQLNKNQTRFKAGTEVEYTCDIGFVSSSPTDVNKAVCLDDAKWSDMNLRCVRVQCNKPDEISNGIIKANDFFYSSVIEYKCVPGYHIRNGDYLRECDLNGQWTGQPPTCEPVDCGEPPFLKNGIANYNSTRFESVAFYSCVNQNYYMEGANWRIKCLPNGRWESSFPKCIEKKCSLNANEYSKKYYNIFASNQAQNSLSYPINTIIRVMCQPGYELVGSSQLICLPESRQGIWDKPLPICREELHCSFVNPPENGLINSNKLSTLNGYPLHTVLDFSCLPGYNLNGSKQYHCLERADLSGADWSEEISVSCLPNPTTRSTITTRTTTSTTTSTTTTLVTTSLTSATRHAPPSHTKYESCRIDSSSMLLSYSSLITISTPHIFNELAFTNVSVGNYVEHGQSAAYSCKNHPGTFLARCLNGTLFMQQNCHELLSKDKLSCTAPPKIPNGYNKYGSTSHGSKALYQCFNGYELAHGQREMRCVNGEWVGQIPACVKINCVYPGVLINGRILYIGTLSEYTYQPYMNNVGQNKQIRYECDRDYKLIGPNGSTCINGNWKPSPKLARCVKESAKPGVISSQSENESGHHDEARRVVKYSGFSSPDFEDLFDGKNNTSLLRGLKLKRLKKHKLKMLKARKLNKKAVRKAKHRHEKKTYLNKIV